MKKIFSLFVAMMVAVGMSAAAIYDWAGEIGTTHFGSGGKTTVSVVKIHDNSDEIPAIKFEKGYKIAEGHYMVIYPAEGAFKAGDSISFSAVINNSGARAEKYAMVQFYAADGATRLFQGDTVVNGQKMPDDPIVEGFKLTTDQDSILIGRYGTTNMFITMLTVLREGEAPAHTYTVAGDNLDLFGTSWDATNEANNMFLQEDNSYKWEKANMSLPAGQIQFKVVEDHNWDIAYPADNYILNIEEAGVYTIDIYYNPNDNNYVGAVATKAIELPSVILIGEMNGWDGSESQLTPAADGLTATAKFELSMNENSGYGFKILVGGMAMSKHHEGADWYGLGRDAGLVKLDWQGDEIDPIWLAMDMAGEYTFIFTFADSTLEVLFPAQEPVEHTYTVAGGSAELFGTTWDPSNADNDMVKLEDGTYKWEKENLTIAAGSIGFKVCEDHAWTHAYPAQDYQLPISEAGIYTITITFNPEGNVVAAIANKTGDAVVIPSVAMHGDFINKSWADTENFTVAEDNASASLTLNLAADNYEFGMRIGGSGNWTANGSQFTRESNAAVIEAGSGNLKLIADVDGDYVFTWTYATSTLTITFPAQEGIEEVVAAGKTVKIVRNGQMLIMKGDKIFNAQGAIVK